MIGLNQHDFAGRHWETGSVQNALAWRGVKAPHTGQPYSEALLLGVSGGIAFGYFVFEYKGYLPHVALLTRNTFAPLDTLLERLAIPQDDRQTTSEKTAAANLAAALDSGHAPLVWADSFSMPYNDQPRDAGMWGMLPVVVAGSQDDTFYVADRSRRLFKVAAETLADARGRGKHERHRQVVVDAPNEGKLPAAVQKGIWDCIKLFTEMPPRGSRDNFGLAALLKWAKMLTNTRHKKSWERTFAAGPRLYQALAGSTAQPGVFSSIMTWGAAPDGERGLYADFLDEAAVILNKPGLREAAEQFRASAALWHALAESVLPDEHPALAEAKTLHLRRRALFIEQGEAATGERRALKERLRALQAEAAEAFPLNATQVTALRERMAENVLKMRDLEQKAVENLQKVMG